MPLHGKREKTMAKYLDPKADLTFKKVFGEHKNLVISLLNALLPLDDGKKVESIEYMTPGFVPRTPLTDYTLLDVLCEETGGRQFIVEMQVSLSRGCKRPAILRHGKVYVWQRSLAEKYTMSMDVYSLCFVNFIFDSDDDGYYHHYPQVQYYTNDVLLEGLHLVVVELPKFKAKNHVENDMRVLWLRFLSEIDEKTRRVPQALMDNPQVNQALGIIEEIEYDDAEVAAYDGFWDRVSRENTFIADAVRSKEQVDAANARGDTEKARADAATEKLRQSARKMKSKGFSVDDIVEFTGLVVDEIKAL